MLRLVLIAVIAAVSITAVNPFDFINSAKFILVHGNSPANNTRYAINNLVSLINHKRFDLKRKTVLYCHGWTDDFDSEGTQAVTSAYIKRNDHNIVVLDWGQFSFSILHVAVVRSSIFSKHAGKALMKLFQLGVDANKFHCVGHSIGAHMCGIIGRGVLLLSSGRYKLKRITALDAALPLYYPAISVRPLSPHDAEFVDALHTNTLFAGLPYRIGHADFYPNDGKMQSGCPDLHVLDVINNFCSHFASLRYWSESLVSEKSFPAKRCNSWSAFKSGRCDNNPTNYMGYDAQPGLRGMFFNEIIAKRSFFESANSKVYDYFATSFAKRSDIAKFLKQYGILLS